MLDFKGINIESIKLRLGSLFGRVFSYHKEEHNEKTLTQVVGTQIAQQQIATQVVLNLPGGLQRSDQKKLLDTFIGGDTDNTEEVAISTEASGGAQLPTKTTNAHADNFLRMHLAENKEDNSLLLDRSELYFIYKERNNISFSEDEVIFLIQSSVKNDFPVWFWSFYYREKFGNVMPLFQKAFQHTSLRVRRGVIIALNNFKDTGEDIVKLAETENDAAILGFIVTTLLENKLIDFAQRVITNALTRRIVPSFTEKAAKNLSKNHIDLGPAEKRFLYSRIENGWPEEKIQVLNVLCMSTEETDLVTLENLFDRAAYATIKELILVCIKRIGKTNKTKEIERELLETRHTGSFIACLDALVAVKYFALFPLLLEWLRDAEKVTSRLWGEIDKSKLESQIQDAISALLDKNTYELLVQDILKHYSPNEYGNIMSWRHFWVLKEQKNKQMVASLIKTETRLEKYKEWDNVLAEICLNEKVTTRDKEQLLSLISLGNLKQNLFILRKAYELITPTEALKDVAPVIEKIRSNLISRLETIASEEHSKEIKEIANNDLDKFLGENRKFYRLYIRKGKKSGSDTSHQSGGEKDRVFEALSEDIDQFNYIENEYLIHIFKAGTLESSKLLMECIGRPYNCIYESIRKETDETNKLKNALTGVIENHPNPMVKIKAIEAAHRIGVIDAGILRDHALILLNNAKTKVKTSIGLSKDKNEDNWYEDEITYIWALNVIEEFGDLKDFPIIQEEVYREKIFSRNYYRYSYFLYNEVFETLLNISEYVEDEEKKSVVSALSSLDYRWTKKILGIET